MASQVLPWVQATEKVVGKGHPTLPDVENRPLRTLLTLNGLNPDAVHSGLVPTYNAKACGAVADGLIDDYANLNQFALDINTAGGGVLYFSGNGLSYRIGSSWNIPASVFVEFAPGCKVSVDAAMTLTINSRVRCDSPVQLFTGAGAVVLSKTVNSTVWADWFSGANIGAKVNAAKAAVTSGPATIKISSQSHSFSTTIDLTDTHGLCLKGEHGSVNSVTDWGPNLIWTGGAASGPALKAPGSIALEISHINLSYNAAAYNGNLLSLNSTGGAMNTGEAHIHHCRVSGTPTALSAASLIELNVTLGTTIEHTTLDYAAVGIKCTGNSCNNTTIGNGVWLDKHFTDCAVKAWGHGWTFGALVHECDPNTGVALTPLMKLAGDSSVFRFAGCWSGDGGDGGGTILDFDTGGFSCDGIDINMLTAHASGTFLKLSNTAGKNHGVAIHGCRIDHASAGGTVGFHLGRADSIAISGNEVKCATGWTGTEPTRVFVPGSNNWHAVTTNGIPVANNASIPITPPGANNGGALVSIWSNQDNTQALYALSGGASATNEIFDASGSFTNAVGGAGALNVYWDGASTTYRIQNLRGTSRTLVISFLMGA